MTLEQAIVEKVLNVHGRVSDGMSYHDAARDLAERIERSWDVCDEEYGWIDVRTQPDIRAAAVAAFLGGDE